MNTLAKNHVCDHCVIGKKKHLKKYLSGPESYRDLPETGPRSEMEYWKITYFVLN